MHVNMCAAMAACFLAQTTQQQPHVSVDPRGTLGLCQH